MERIDADDEDFEALRPTLVAKVGGAWVAVTGVFTLVLALQTGLVAARWYVFVVAAAQLIVGGLLLACGVSATRMRGWGALGGTVASAVAGVCGIGWFGFAFYLGMVSLLALMIPPFALTGAVLLGLSIPRAFAADKARFRLKEAGLDAGR